MKNVPSNARETDLDVAGMLIQVASIMTTNDMADILPATTVKRRFLELLAQLGTDRSRITITRNGLPAGVLMSVEEYESLLETLEILADRPLTRGLASARKRLAKGRTLRHDEVWPAE